MQEIRCVRGYLHQGAFAITSSGLGSCVNTAFYGLFCRRKAAKNVSSRNESRRGALVVRQSISPSASARLVRPPAESRPRPHRCPPVHRCPFRMWASVEVGHRHTAPGPKPSRPETMPKAFFASRSGSGPGDGLQILDGQFASAQQVPKLPPWRSCPLASQKYRSFGDLGKCNR